MSVKCFDAVLSGKRIEQLRSERNWTQLKLASELSVDPSVLSKIETGKRSNIQVIVGAASIFGASTDYILGISDNIMLSGKNLDKYDLFILEQIKKYSNAEKAVLLKHLELENELKSR